MLIKSNKREVDHKKTKWYFFLWPAIVCTTFSNVIQAAVGDREQAKFIHDRLTGQLATDAMLDRMEERIVNGDELTAALYAIDGAPNDAYGSAVEGSGGFYNVVVKNWASPWTNEEQDIFQPLNDYSATVIGLVRDSGTVDFRELLYGNTIYTSDGSVGGVPAYANSNNDHYEALEATSAKLADVLQRRTQTEVTGLPATAAAGIMTTRAAARAYFIDGTNRAMFRFIVLHHLCNDLEQYKDNTRPSDRIRQDVSRSPGGDSALFLNECSACHSGMDPMAQAFAYYQYDYPSEEEQPSLSEEQRKELGALVYTPDSVQEKYLINAGNFRNGFVTDNDHWTNYWRLGPNSQKIGWLNPPTNSSPSNIDMALDPQYSEGDGAASLGEELANTEAFAYCQVRKAFQTVCLREPQQDDGATLDTITSNFKSGYNMKQAFAEVAVYCSGHLNP